MDNSSYNSIKRTIWQPNPIFWFFFSIQTNPPKKIKKETLIEPAVLYKKTTFQEELHIALPYQKMQKA